VNHEINITNKSLITVSEVTSVDGFDEEAIFVNLKEEGLVIYGKNLHIEGLDLEDGKLVAAGKIESLTYTKKKIKKSIWERLRK